MSQYRAARVGLIIGAGAGLATTGILALTQRLGDDGARSVVVVAPQVDQYCLETFGDSATPDLVEPSPFGWRCVSERNGVFGSDPVDPAALCLELYGSGQWQPNDGSSWRCIQP